MQPVSGSSAAQCRAGIEKSATTSRSAKLILLATKHDLGLQNFDGEKGYHMSFIDNIDRNEDNVNIQIEREQINENTQQDFSTQPTYYINNEDEEARLTGHDVLLLQQHLQSQNIEEARLTENVLCSLPQLQSHDINYEIEAIPVAENVLLSLQRLECDKEYINNEEKEASPTGLDMLLPPQHLQSQIIKESRPTENNLSSPLQLQSRDINNDGEAIPLTENILLFPQQLQCDKESASSLISHDRDFGSSSSDDFALGTDETTDNSSCSSVPEKRKKKKPIPNKTKNTTPSTTIAQSENTSTESEKNPQEQAGCSFWMNNGMTEQGKKRKPRKSEKERREDRIQRQNLRNKRLGYITNKGKIKKPREMQELSMCRQKCKDRLEPDLRKKLFKEYWSLGDPVKRAMYLEKCIETKKKASSKSSPKKRRTFSNLYYVQDSNLKKLQICKGCLLRTFDETNRFLQSVYENKLKYGQIQARKTRKNCRTIPEDKLEEIKSHINSFPSSDSHYGRSKTTKKFLNSELTLQKMYDLYKEQFANPVSKTIYDKVFKCLNLSFKKPSLDTCSKCDGIKIKLKYITGEEAVLLADELKNHQLAFQSAYDKKRDDKKRAQESEDIAVICFDLQQCLPTPFLNTNVAFYKRQLWTYNLTIHDLKTNKAFCYMWPECTGGRGANDIASCLYDFIVHQLPLLHPKAKLLIMYSDSCPGQNKNSIVTTMLMMATKFSPQLNTIEHKFLVPGHTHMEADSDHALIERKKKRTSMDIHLPRDWYQLVRTASNKATKFTVIEMDQCMFYDFNGFAKQYLSIKKINQNNEKFVWANVRHFKYTKNDFPRFSYKEEFDSGGDFLGMDFAKRGKNYDLVTIDLVKKSYLSRIPISTEKKKDLCHLLPFIHESAHEFYRALPCKADVIDTAAYSDNSDEN